MRKKILLALYSFIEKHPLIVIAISFVFGIIFFLAFKFIPLQSDYIDLLPQKMQPVVKMRYLSKVLKGVGQFSLVISSDACDTKKMESIADTLYKEIIKIKEIQYVNYKIPKDFLINNFYLFIEEKDLKEIYNRLREKVQYELWKDAPLLLILKKKMKV